MKKTIPVSIAIIFFTVGMISCASSPVPQESKSEIVEVPGKSADNLFALANSWLIDTMNNAKSVIQFSDKSEGIIKGKYADNYQSITGTDYYAQTIITIQVKEGRARIQLDPDALWAIDPHGRKYDNYSTMADTSRIASNRDKLIASFKLAMTATGEGNNNDW